MILKFTNGTTIVSIEGVKFDENLESKFLANINIPQGGAVGIQVPETKILHLASIPRLFSVTGHIIATSSEVGGTPRTYADEALNDLRDMIKDTGGVTMSVKDSSDNRLFTKIDNSDADITGFVQKLQYSCVSSDEDRPSMYSVIISFIEATNLKS